MENVVASASPGPKPNRTVFAVLLVVISFVAFVGSFYMLGGAAIVQNLVSDLMGTGAPATTATAPTTAPAEASALPAGVDAPFAQRVFSEQLASQDNIVQLVNGEVTSFRFAEATKTADGVSIAITASFKDGTSGPGKLELQQRQGQWFFASIAGNRGTGTGGLADGVSMGGSSDVRPLKAGELDEAVMKTMIAEQVKSQSVLAGVADGTISEVTMGSPKESVGTATLPVVLKYTSGASASGTVVCIKKQVDGADAWFITSFTK